jgi:hypothetical protein
MRSSAAFAVSTILALLGASLVTTGSAWAGTARFTSNVETAQQLMTAAVRSAASEKAFDSTSTVVSGDNGGDIQTDSGLTGGLQFVTERIHGQTEKVSIILIGQTVYVKGNLPGLHEFMAFTAAAAQREAGSWIRLTLNATTATAERNFWQAAGDSLTVGTAAPEIELSGQLSVGPNTTVLGQPARQIDGTVTSNGQVTHEVVYVRANGLAVPIEETATATAPSEHETTVFGGWGVAPVLHAPASSVPVAVSWLGPYWS